MRFNEFEVTVLREAYKTHMIMQQNGTGQVSTEEIGTAMVGVATAGASLLQIIFVGSLAQVWGMINGL